MPCGATQGKYMDGGPRDARLNKYRGRYAEAESRYGPKPNTRAAVAAYVALASSAGMRPTELAIRYIAIKCRPSFVMSSFILYGHFSRFQPCSPHGCLFPSGSQLPSVDKQCSVVRRGRPHWQSDFSCQCVMHELVLHFAGLSFHSRWWPARSSVQLRSSSSQR
jgi:hypothetical protein